MKIVHAERYAEGAILALEGLPEGGHVLATYCKAINIRTSAGRLLTLQTRGTALGPFGIVIQADDPPDWPQANTTCILEGRYLTLGSLVVDLGFMQLSMVPAIPAMHDCWSAEWAMNLLAPFASRSLIPVSDMIGNPTSSHHPLSQACLDLAITVHQRSDGHENLIRAASRLVGWGPGSTPSGDDFLLGFIGSWGRLASSSSPPQSVLAQFAESAAHATTPLAAEFYMHLARGRLSEPIDLLLHAIASNDQERTESALKDLARFGASSGYDTIAGMLLYLKARTQAQSTWRSGASLPRIDGSTQSSPFGTCGTES